MPEGKEEDIRATNMQVAEKGGKKKKEIGKRKRQLLISCMRTEPVYGM